MSPPPNPDGARSILSAATALFARDGYDCVSVAEIATQARVCKANVFHHFESKEALYLAVILQASAEHADYAEALLDAPGASADKIFQLIRFEINNLLDNEQRSRLIQRECGLDGHLPTRKLARGVFQRNFSAVVALFEQGRTRGEFRQDIDPAAAALLVGGSTQTFFRCREALQELRETRDLESPAVYAKSIAGLILSGVVAPTAIEKPAKAVRRRAHRRAA